jgi:hypothetical protein
VIEASLVDSAGEHSAGFAGEECLLRVGGAFVNFGGEHPTDARLGAVAGIDADAVEISWKVTPAAFLLRPHALA